MVNDSIEGVVIGDLHWQESVDRGTWSDMPGVRGDLEYALRKTVELCVADKADLYLAGDNFDGPDPEPESVSALYAILRPILDSKFDIYYVIGNHERGRDWLAPLGYKAIRIEDGKAIRTRFGRTVSGLNFQDPDRFEDLVRMVPKTDIGLYHQSFREWTGGRGFPLSCLPPHRLAICGDTHVQAVVRPQPAVVRLSPGSLVPQSTTEFDSASKVWRITSELDVMAVSLPGRKRIRRVIENADQADAVLAEIAKLNCADGSLPPRIREPIVAVRLMTPIPGFTDVLRKLAGDRGFHIRVSDDSKSRSPRQQQARSGSATLVEAILSWDAPQDAKDLALAALSPGADPKSVFARDLRAQTEIVGSV